MTNTPFASDQESAQDTEESLNPTSTEEAIDPYADPPDEIVQVSADQLAIHAETMFATALQVLREAIPPDADNPAIESALHALATAFSDLQTVVQSHKEDTEFYIGLYESEIAITDLLKARCRTLVGQNKSMSAAIESTVDYLINTIKSR